MPAKLEINLSNFGYGGYVKVNGEIVPCTRLKLDLAAGEPMIAELHVISEETVATLEAQEIRVIHAPLVATCQNCGSRMFKTDE